MWKLAGLTAVITGAGSGIGRALALTLAARGCRLALCDVDAAGLDGTLDALGDGAAHRVLTRQIDVTDRDALAAFAKTCQGLFGGVDVVINNAGVGLGPVSAGEVDERDFRWLMEINFWGVVHGTQLFLPQLVAAPRSAVVNVSSLFGLIGMVDNAAYCSAKFAVRGFTEALRADLALKHPHVLAMAVHPGGIRTNISRSSRKPVNVDATLHRDRSELFHTRALRLAPEAAAEQIVSALERRRNRVCVGADAKAMDIVARLVPRNYHRLMLAFAARQGLL